jgi:hypothetical protein
MKLIGFALLSLAATASASVAASVRRPVALPSKACCENCTVARYRPAGVPVVETTMVTQALLWETALAGAGLLAMVVLRGRRRPPEPRPESARAPRPTEA